MAPRSSLSIRRLKSRYIVASDHHAPESVRGRLDEMATGALPRVLATAVESWARDEDTTIWLIRRLEVDVDLNAAWNRARLARVWAGRISRVLLEALEERGDNVLCFAGRADYLARFLTDLAAGAAWGKWYYVAFDGLRLLPASALPTHAHHECLGDRDAHRSCACSLSLSRQS